MSVVWLSPHAARTATVGVVTYQLGYTRGCPRIIAILGNTRRTLFVGEPGKWSREEEVFETIVTVARRVFYKYQGLIHAPRLRDLCVAVKIFEADGTTKFAVNIPGKMSDEAFVHLFGRDPALLDNIVVRVPLDARPYDAATFARK